jgi:biotin carboxylase
VTTPLLAVPYDRGAVSAGDIAVGLRDLCRPVFLVRRTPHTDRARPVLEQLGPVLPLDDLTAAVAALRALGPAGIVTYSELMLADTAALAAALGLPGHSTATARLLTDKVWQRRRLREAGVDDVRSTPVHVADWTAAVAAVGLPAVVKPVYGEGSRHTHAVPDAAAAAALLPGLLAGAPAGRGMVLEELLVGGPRPPWGDYVSVESLCTPDGAAHLAVTGKYPLVPPFREPGQYWPAALGEDDRRRVLDLTTRALAALGVCHGLTHTEVKLTPDGPRLIEVNGRLGGHIGELAARACGVDLVRLAAEQALGRPVRPPELAVRRVHYQAHTLAPTAPCTVVRVHGDREVRRLPGVSGHRAFVRAGERLPGGVMTHELDLTWGECDDHAAMFAVLATARAALRYDLRPDGAGESAAVHHLSAADLNGADPWPC